MDPLKPLELRAGENAGPGWARIGVFVLLCGVVAIAFRSSMGTLIRAASANELYSHILLVPFVSAYTVYAERKGIFSGHRGPLPWGIAVVAAGIVLYLVGNHRAEGLTENDYLSVMTFAAVLCVWGGFMLAFGTVAFRGALFPMLFLLFAVPVPGFLMDRIVSLLQYCSAETSDALFALTGVPVYRDGYIFQLPGIAIEVAKQCGGIRSSLALLITSVLAGHLFLRTGWRKGILAVSVVPITVFKNAVRIVMLTLLGAYVDPRILSSTLHRRGGIPFFFGALALVGVVLWLLRRSERRSGTEAGLLQSVDGIF